MLWRQSVAVALLVGGLCSCVKADGMSRLMLPRDYGVKLCGREFIRAVIFTCGGSRWRRSQDRESDPFQSIVSDIVTMKDNQESAPFGAKFTADNISPLSIDPSLLSLADLLALYRALGEGDRQQIDMAPMATVLDKRGVFQVKKKRNFSLGVAGKCCSQGCTKYDIGRLC